MGYVFDVFNADVSTRGGVLFVACDSSGRADLSVVGKFEEVGYVDDYAPCCVRGDYLQFCLLPLENLTISRD